MFNIVKYLSSETYLDEILSDKEYDNIEHKKERFFQLCETIPDYKNIRMSETGMYSVCKLEESVITTMYIKNFYNMFIDANNPKCENITITDATANAGGNTLNFSLSGFNVNAIELSKKEFERLENNVNEYKLNKIKLFNRNSIDILLNTNELFQDIVYFDPPWGGTSYKQYRFIGLSIGENDIGDNIDKLLESNKCKLVVLKGPFNTYIKNKKYLNLILNIKIQLKSNKIGRNNIYNKNYYNLYFFSKENKSNINSYYKNNYFSNEFININPFNKNNINNKFREIETSYRYNYKWNIYNGEVILKQ